MRSISKLQKPLFIYAFVVALIIFALPTSARMSSTNYGIVSDVIGSAEGESESDNHKLLSNLGEEGVGKFNSENWGVNAGFLQAINSQISVTVDPDSVNFKDLISAETASTAVSVNTDAIGGYTLYAFNGGVGYTETLRHSNKTDYVTDLTDWDPSANLGSGNASTWSGDGFGFTVYANDNSEKNTTWWGTGTTESDASNKYAGLPATTVTAPTHYWNFEEGTGTTTDDQIGTNHGTLTNMETGDWTESPHGNQDHQYGLQFDGVDEYVDVGTIASTANASHMAWVKIIDDDYTGQQYVYGGIPFAGTDNAATYIMGLTRDDSCIDQWYTVVANGSSNQYVCSGISYDSDNFPTGAWVHLAVTYDGSNVVFYKDGVEMADITQTVSGANSATNFSIGKAGAYPDFYSNIVVDEVRLYESTLTADEVRQIYESKVTSTQAKIVESFDFKSGERTSNIGYKISVPANQTAGTYKGYVTYIATVNL